MMELPTFTRVCLTRSGRLWHTGSHTSHYYVAWVATLVDRDQSKVHVLLLLSTYYHCLCSIGDNMDTNPLYLGLIAAYYYFINCTKIG